MRAAAAAAPGAAALPRGSPWWVHGRCLPLPPLPPLAIAAVAASHEKLVALTIARIFWYEHALAEVNCPHPSSQPVSRGKHSNVN